jgi:hypothetical protein
MARTTQQQLDDLDALIARLETGGVEEYQHGAERQRMPSLSELYKRRDLLTRQLASETGGTFSLLDPIQR